MLTVADRHWQHHRRALAAHPGGHHRKGGVPGLDHHRDGTPGRAALFVRTRPTPQRVSILRPRKKVLAPRQEGYGNAGSHMHEAAPARLVVGGGGCAGAWRAAERLPPDASREREKSSISSHAPASPPSRRPQTLPSCALGNRVWLDVAPASPAGSRLITAGRGQPRCDAEKPPHLPAPQRET